MKMASLTKEDIRSVIETIKELYLEDMIPWICGYSGGKDSTAVVQLVWYALQELPQEKLKKTVHVISTDTLVESPVVAIWATESLKKMEQAAKERGLPIVPHRLTPAITNTFWVNLIGRGYPYPRRDFRWCTDRMKIDASNRFIKSILDAESEAIMVLGSRKAESAVRKAVLEGYEKKRYRAHLSPNGSFPNSYVFTPIENWLNDNVWQYLVQVPNPWGHSNKDLLAMYSGASADGECPLVIDSSTPSCGNSRFGCWVCTMVTEDIFTLYLQGFSTSEIARELNKLNIPTKAGKETWRPSRVAYILKNERYIGDSFYQKTYRETTVPFNQHLNRGQEDRFYAKGTHPGIVEKDVFDAAQTLIAKRKDVFAKATTQNIYPLTSRIQCSECGSFYRRRIVSGTVKWVCSLHKDDSTACDSNYYSEERIYDGFISMVNKLRFSEDNILGQVINRLEMTLAAMKRNNLAARDLSKSIAELNAKLLMLEQLRSKGYLAPEVYQAQANEISADLAKLKDVRQEKFNSKAAIMLEEVKKLKMLIFELEEPLEAFDERLFLEIVKSIQINKEDEMSVELLGGLRFRERI